MFDIMNDTHEFHAHMGLYPTVNCDEKTVEAKRIALLQEETAELIEAIESGDVGKILHEATDVLYIVAGLLVERGITPAQAQAAWAHVHAANMNKCPASDPLKKPTKPADWKPADMSAALSAKSKIIRWALSYIGKDSGMATVIVDVEGDLTGVKLAQIASNFGAECILTVSKLGESDPVFPTVQDSEVAELPTIYAPDVVDISDFMEYCSCEYFRAKELLTEHRGNFANAHAAYLANYGKL